MPPKEYAAPWGKKPPVPPAKKAAKKAAKRSRRGSTLALEVKPSKAGAKPKKPAKPLVPKVTGSAKEEQSLERLLAQANAIVPGITAEQMGDALGLAGVQRQGLTHFASELVKDFDPFLALLRTGFLVVGGDPASVKIARREAKTRYLNPYVQLLVREWLETVKEESLFTTGQLIARLWAEANDFVNGSAVTRIMALKELARIRRIGGLQLPNQGGPVVNVMFVPLVAPQAGATALDVWGQVAETSQKNLTRQAAS